MGLRAAGVVEEFCAANCYPWCKCGLLNATHVLTDACPTSAVGDPAKDCSGPSLHVLIKMVRCGGRQGKSGCGPIAACTRILAIASAADMKCRVTYVWIHP